jgi:hypothetical protein
MPQCAKTKLTDDLRAKLAAVTCEGCRLGHKRVQEKDEEDNPIWVHVMEQPLMFGPLKIYMRLCTNSADELLPIIAEESARTIQECHDDLVRCLSESKDPNLLLVMWRDAILDIRAREVKR